MCRCLTGKKVLVRIALMSTEPWRGGISFKLNRTEMLVTKLKVSSGYVAGRGFEQG
ncbi:hypothetical protein F2Q69_00039450 [Brassica cretica]|uniref:Uncharacterized protein n=1 Tax=Brassica cretica TaxID=69181 RepID=A0A8S9NLL6_BRACR|nr:hypothetical protein F2Q69_00039450 [Brassica cretica]